MRRKILVNDKMQQGYQYFLSEPEGENFDPTFTPELTPKEMLELGVFWGKYMTDCRNEFPPEWFQYARLSPEGKNPKLNYFWVDASQPLRVWQEKGWIHPEDPRWWFQWYCRYYYGRRLKEEDMRQIKRWRAIRRHVGAIQRNCPSKVLHCRKKQRQVLLHWAYDSRNL